MMSLYFNLNLKLERVVKLLCSETNKEKVKVMTSKPILKHFTLFSSHCVLFLWIPVELSCMNV